MLDRFWFTQDVCGLLKPKCLKHMPPTTAEFRNTKTPLLFKHYIEIMYFYMSMGLSCWTAKEMSPTALLAHCVSLRHYAFQHKKMLSARHEWDFGLRQRSELKAVEAWGKISDISMDKFQTCPVFCNRFINSAKEKTHAFSATNILRSSNEKELFRFESAGVSDNWAIGLFWFWQNQSQKKKQKIDAKHGYDKDLQGRKMRTSAFGTEWQDVCHRSVCACLSEEG